MEGTIDTPTVSIVIPFYAASPVDGVELEFLTECLESVHRQTVEDWEAIVVDDGSAAEPALAKLLRRFGDPRMRSVRHEVNRGLGAARNTGFRAARSDLILPLDCDDRLHRRYLEETLAALAEHPHADCVFTHFHVFGTVQQTWIQQVKPWEQILRAQWIPGPGTMMRRSIWELAGGYTERDELPIQEDWDFWIGALSRGTTAIVVPEPLYEYRRWEGSLTTARPKRDYIARRIIYERHRDVFRTHHCGRQFLAEGCLNSSVGAYQSGDRLSSLRLAIRGLRYTPGNPHLWWRVAAACLPVGLVKRVRPVSTSHDTA